MKHAGNRIEITAAILASIVAFNIHAQSFPSKPLRLIVPFPPGGPGEVIARPVAEGLQPLVGQPVVLDFKPGAGAILGMQSLMASPADGYTLFVGSNVLVLSKWLFKDLPYDPQRDLRGIVSLASSPYLVLVSSSFSGSTIGDLVNAAKAAPGKLNFASSGPGTQSHISAELFNDLAGIKMTHVPYKGAGPAFPALMAGDVTVFFDNVFSSVGQVKGGRIKPLGVSSLARVAQYPSLPTVDEQGVKGYDTSSWFGIVAAKAVPDAIVARLNDALNKALQSPEVRERYGKLGVMTTGGGAQEFQKMMDGELEKTGRVVRSVGITVN
ncbi:MAG: tripartite tricarboxylate transporter substrate binding protein [Betaproteobacteria bacterium]|nr:tripartite tricarboxylate transporter substrate binding protein [Betaproteobacteria bacterium]